MARLPTPGSDDGTWGDILNSFLEVSHAADGSLNSGVVSDANVASNAAISKSKLASDVQTSLSSADTSVQSVNGKTPASGAITLGASDLGAGVTSGTMANRPTAASYTGWYFATDVNGGTMYHSDGSTWTQVNAGVTAASGQQLAYAQTTGLSFTVNTTGTTTTDVSASLQITVPSSSVPVLISAKIFGQLVTGTAAAGTNLYLRLYLTDSNNNMYDVDAINAYATGTSAGWLRSMYVSTVLPAPVTSTTFKLRANLSTLPSGLGSSGFGAGGVFPSAWIQAVAQ